MDELIGRVADITGLNRRAAQVVATSLANTGPGPWSAGAIVRMAEALGYDFDRQQAATAVKADPAPFEAEITMDEAKIVAELYSACPRAIPPTGDGGGVSVPAVGKAPEAAQEDFGELIDQLPDDARAMLVKVNVVDRQATFWLYDQANQIDRAIGPIDLSRYTNADALHQAFQTLLRRANKVMAADFN